ncbi:hypothetical protein Tco_0278800, partial [Tanacetum coccineum]
TTATTTTLPLPPPLLQQSTTVPELATVYDLHSKIDKYVNEVIKESVHNALQAPIHERFRELSEFEMKYIFHDRMFKSASYISHLEHTLYEALEAPMDHENREEFNEEMAKSHKRRRDDQDPPLPPPKDSNIGFKKAFSLEVLSLEYF